MGGFSWVNYTNTTFVSGLNTVNVGSTNAIGSNGTFTTGDLLVAAVMSWGGTISPTAFVMPAGWTNIYTTPTNAGNNALSVWYKFAGASESGSYTTTWTQTGGGSPSWILANYGQGWWGPTASSNFQSDTGAPVAPSISTTGPNQLVIAIASCIATALTGFPAGFTARVNNVDMTSNPQCMALGDMIQATTGATGSASWTGPTFNSVTAGLVSFYAAPAPNSALMVASSRAGVSSIAFAPVLTPNALMDAQTGVMSVASAVAATQPVMVMILA